MAGLELILLERGVDFRQLVRNAGRVGNIKPRIDRIRPEIGLMKWKKRGLRHGPVLGGTELTLLLPFETVAGLPALNTTAIYVDAIVKQVREV